MSKKWNVKTISLIGIMGGLGGILMYFKFSIPFMPPFMDFDFSSVPEMIGGFALGPIAAIFIILIKLIVKLAIMGTSTMFTGELSNLLVSCAYVLPAVIVYRRNKTKKGALTGIVLGVISVIIVAVFTNLVIIVPFYVKMMGYTMELVIQACNAVNPMVTNVLTFALFGIVPFNLIKYGVASVVTYILYKRVSGQIKKFTN